ncbi:hypothetical protein BH09PAT2_BH09PAT2_01520 [soil metagenome]
MKRFLSTFFILSFLFFFFASQSMAQSIDTVIKGTVSDSNGAGVNGANVSVVCDGVTRNTTTTSVGDYLVMFSRAECAQGDNATATATASEGTGSNDGTVQRFTFGPGLELDIAIINISVPEFGMVTGVVTAIGSGIAYLGLKRKFII